MASRPIVLLTLGHLLGEQRYLDAAERTVHAGLHSLERYPEGHPDAAARARRAARAAAGRRRARADQRVRRVAQSAATRATTPRRLTFTIPADAANLRGVLAERTSRGEQGTAYVCEGLTCRAPIDTPEALASALATATGATGRT